MRTWLTVGSVVGAATILACTSSETSGDPSVTCAGDAGAPTDALGIGPREGATGDGGDESSTAPLDGAGDTRPSDAAAPPSFCSGDAASAQLTMTNQSYASDARVRPSEALFSFINTVDDPTPQTLRLHNGAMAALQITRVEIGPATGLFPASYRQFSLPQAFSATSTRALPITLAPGEDLDIAVQFRSTQTSPPDRMQNIGGHAVAATLIASGDGGCAQAGLFGVSLWNDSESLDPVTMRPTANYARYEPTFGQLLATLGYRVNVGPAWTALLNTNDMTVPPQPNTISEEIALPRFVKANAAEPVGLLAVARFSPRLDMPFGWYPAGSVSAAEAQAPDGGARPTGLQVVATMSSSLDSDVNTSDHSEQVLPPLTDGSAISFDPGSTAFALWAFTNQRSYGNPTLDGGPAPTFANGDYMYTEDALNVDAAHQHRARVYPLKDRSGTLVPNGYLIGWEEASNGDYQDYVFVLTNANAPPAPATGPEPSAE